MNISENGKKLIKKYEGCRLKAYKPVLTEKYWTIGWGYYGPDVRAGQVITQKQANVLFDKDIQVYVNHVKALKMILNQNQFDALVSFCYNCGVGNLNRLCSDRNVVSISKWITAYNKGGGKVLQGLVRRRAEEKALFDEKTIETVSKKKPTYYTKKYDRLVTLTNINLYKDKNLKTKIKRYKKGGKLNILGIVTSDGGATRFKVKGGYVSANQEYVKAYNLPDVITVKSGDVLSKIAANNNTTVAKLVKLNKIKDPNQIYVGQKIKLK